MSVSRETPAHTKGTDSHYTPNNVEHASCFDPSLYLPAVVDPTKHVCTDMDSIGNNSRSEELDVAFRQIITVTVVS